MPTFSARLLHRHILCAAFVLVALGGCSGEETRKRDAAGGAGSTGGAGGGGGTRATGGTGGGGAGGLGGAGGQGGSSLDARADGPSGGGSDAAGDVARADVSGAADARPLDGPRADAAVDRAAGTDARDAAAADVVVAVDAASPSPDAAEPDAAEDAASSDDGGAGDASVDAVAMCGRIWCDCTFKGKKLWGRVKFVTTFPYDFRVRVVTNNLPDLYVQLVPTPGLTTRCGQWQQNDNFPDFRVMEVTGAGIEDFSIQYDNLLPGIPGMRF